MTRSRRKIQNGFTLIETLVVMLVLVTVGSIILSIFVIGLTGAAKIRSQQIVRENGSYTVAQISRFIQFAQKFNYVDPDLAVSNDEMRSCVTGASGDPLEVQGVSVTSFEGTESIFSCRSVNVGTESVMTIASQSAAVSQNDDISLINLDKVRISNNECYFTCKQFKDTDPPTIGLHFRLVPKNASVQPILFETSVIPRNF